MMELMTRIRIEFPRDLDPQLKTSIMSEERDRGAALRSSGHLLRTWRVPGRIEVLQVWHLDSPSELNEILRGLPVFPYISRCDVEALAEHPIDPTRHDRPRDRPDA